MTKLLSSLRRRSSSRSSSHWGRWPTCRCPAFRPGARSGFLTWRQQILFISCPWLSLGPCSSSWRWEFFYPTSEQHLCLISVEQVNKWCKSDKFWWWDVTSFFSWVPSLVSTTPTCEPWKPCSGSCPLSSSPWPSTSLQSVCCTLSSDLSSVCSFHVRKPSLFFTFKPSSGGVYLLADLQLLLLGSSSAAETPCCQRKIQHPREDQAPSFSPAPEWRLCPEY